MAGPIDWRDESTDGSWRCLANNSSASADVTYTGGQQAVALGSVINQRRHRGNARVGKVRGRRFQPAIAGLESTGQQMHDRRRGGGDSQIDAPDQARFRRRVDELELALQIERIVVSGVQYDNHFTMVGAAFQHAHERVFQTIGRADDGNDASRT